MKDKVFNSMQFNGAFFFCELLLSRKDSETSIGSRGASVHRGVVATEGLGASGKAAGTIVHLYRSIGREGFFFPFMYEECNLEATVAIPRLLSGALHSPYIYTNIKRERGGRSNC
jgi:hypothetical protein